MTQADFEETCTLYIPRICHVRNFSMRNDEPKSLLLVNSNLEKIIAKITKLWREVYQFLGAC